MAKSRNMLSNFSMRTDSKRFLRSLMCSLLILLVHFSEFLKNDKNLFPYNCEKKEDFIKKGIGESKSDE